MLNNKVYKNEVLSYDRQALKVLNGLYGYDFQQEYNIYKHVGRFTINSLVKMYDLDLVNNKVVLLIKSGARYSCDYIYVVEVEANKKINIDLQVCKSGVYDTKLSSFYAKYQFEDARKNDNTIIYIVSQNKNSLGNTHNEPKIDFNKRYKLINVNNCSYDVKKDYNNKVIDSITILDPSKKNTYGHRINYQYSFNFYKLYKVTGLNNAIDKSGYIVSDKQQTLKVKAKQLKVERQKQEFLNGDYKKEVLEVDNIVKDLKSKLIELYSNNDLTYDFMEKFGYSFMHNIQWLLFDIERFKEKINNKEYGSIDAVNNTYNKITEKYNNIIDSLKK